MPIRGIRGAIDVRRNTRGEIHARTQELLQAMVAANRVQVDTIAAAFFTMTRDLNADFPAQAARDMGWAGVPMLCASEIDVPGSLRRVIRVLLLVNLPLPSSRIRHQYLGDAMCLRPDLATYRSRPKSSLRNSSNTKISVGGKP